MLNVCVLGHSLVPSDLVITVPNVNLEVLRYPGATIPSITVKLTEIDFWTRNYDGIIVLIGGNDLARNSVAEVFDKLCDFARRLRPMTNFLTICTVEYRLYPSGNRFQVEQNTYRSKALTINRKIRRFTRVIGARFVDLGRREFTVNRLMDGVHFSAVGQRHLREIINRVVRAYLRSDS